MKIEVTEKFRYEGEEYEDGDVIDLPESIARSVIERGYGKKIEKETPKIDFGEIEEKKGPEWKKKVWISEDRNLTVSVWPPGGKFNTPSVTLEENQRDESGNWRTKRFYLPTGSSLLALSEHLKFAWEKVQTLKSGENT